MQGVESIMPQRIISLVVVLVLLAAVVPVGAQSEIPVPPACTAEEQMQIAEWIFKVSESYSEATEVVEEPATVADFTTAALAMNDVLRMVLDDNSLPYCTDAVLVQPSVEFTLAHHVLMLQASTFHLFFSTSAFASDTQTLDTVMNYLEFHQAKTVTYQEGFFELAELLAAGTPVMEQWLPTCTAEDYAQPSAEQLITLDTAMQDQNEAYIKYLDEGRMDSSLLFDVEDILVDWETMTDDLPPCHDLYMQAAMFGSLHFELTTTLYWAMLQGLVPDLVGDVQGARLAASEHAYENLITYEELFTAPVE